MSEQLDLPGFRGLTPAPQAAAPPPAAVPAPVEQLVALDAQFAAASPDAPPPRRPQWVELEEDVGAELAPPTPLPGGTYQAVITATGAKG